MAGAGILAAAAAAAAATVTVASASQEYPEPAKAQAGHTVFVQGNELAGNTIHAFKRAPTASSPWPAPTPPAGSAAARPTPPPTHSPPRDLSSSTVAPSCSWPSTQAATRSPPSTRQVSRCSAGWSAPASSSSAATRATPPSPATQSKHGKLALTNEAGIATAPSPDSQGVIDLAVTRDNKFLYVQNATSGTIDGFRISSRGTLTKVNTTTGLPAFGKSGMEGIVAD